MPRIVSSLIRRRKFVYLCTNGLLLSTRIRDYTPSPYLTLSVHLDGNRERHDALACRQGVFDSATEAIKLACGKGFRVTINCTLYEGIAAQEVSDFFDFIMSLGVEGIMVSPAYRYAQAPQKDIFLMKTRSIRLFREVLNLGKSRKWKFNHSGLFLDFLAGNQPYTCTPWGNPTRNVFGWQRPCYLLTKEGYASSFKALLEETNWENYGNGRNPKCVNCMLHSGFEPTAVNDTFGHPFKALRVYFRGPRTEGPMVSERPTYYRNPSASKER
jgi:hopanoid biosynthesis associated radical SAM protein HpnH